MSLRHGSGPSAGFGVLRDARFGVQGSGFVDERSCTEVQSKLYVAFDNGYITLEQFENVYVHARLPRAEIRGFINYLSNTGKATHMTASANPAPLNPEPRTFFTGHIHPETLQIVSCPLPTVHLSLPTAARTPASHVGLKSHIFLQSRMLSFKDFEGTLHD